MAIYKDPKPTKNGRAWYFKFSYKDAFGATKQYKSKRFLTKKEASNAEKMFLVTSTDKVEDNNMTFKDLYDEFRMHNDEIMKDTTKYGYDNKEKFIEFFFPIKLKDFNIEHFEKWKKQINSYGYTTNHKNHLFKFFKELLNFATKWYNFNFTATYNKMTNFTDPNEIPKEMLFFTYEEFKKFISVEDDILFKTLFETLYYCGLRRGELRGLTWKDIDFKNQYLSVNKNIVATQGDEKKPYMVTTPKTKSSIRNIPIPKVLMEDMKVLYEVSKRHYGFNDDWYLFGDTDPITNGKLRHRKNKDCKLAEVKQIRIHDFRHSCTTIN